MLYRDLVQFDPIESVIQLREADDQQKAADLVKTYVISERMADQLATLVIPQLQFEQSVDNKGVLVVGNYGTGKSHLMSVLSAIAEYPDVLSGVDNEQVREASTSIAGRFKVLRVEIGSVERSLRDSLLEELAIALDDWGTPYQFPPADQLTNNKDIIVQAMIGFHQRFPDHGLLLIVDELLDFLRSREERQLILDLGFLRELGEVTELSRFRFLGGVQETLFDNPRFSFVAEQLRRVRDRFEQLRIVREDIAYVVSQRLLRKNDQQLAWISEHLRQFLPLYQGMAENLPAFADLFPVHPAYIETFERVYVAEKRQVLRTLSQAMREMLDQDVPAGEPGLISYDQYWDRLRNNPSMRSMPGVSEVVEKSNVLEGRINNAFTRPHLLPMARRIIHALSVHRLTTDDIYVALGPTAEELRDNLALYLQEMPEQTAEFLLGNVQVTLREIMRTVSGQYISFNEGNGQYYLDVKKDVDFEAKIRERGAMMGDDQLNRFFFDALTRLLNLSDTTYISGYSIWFYELPWVEHNVNRPGYLFFGAPDERSTAQPPRDFYIYMLPPFSDRPWQGDSKEDEVLLHLTGLDEHFVGTLRMYAGARALATESATHRETYAEKGDGRSGYLRQIIDWLRANLVSHLQITHDGVERAVRAILAETRSSASSSFEELLQLVSAHLLAPCFAATYPGYPSFSLLNQPVSEAGREPAAIDAIRFLAGRGRTNLATAVLRGLKLVDNDGAIRPYESPYARKYLELLHEKPEGQVVNRGELIEIVGTGSSGTVEKDIPFKLEPEWSVCILLALVYNGDITLNLGGQNKLDAGSIERAAITALADMVDFRFYGRPKEMPLARWIAVFEGLGLSPGLIREESSRETAVIRLQETVQAELNRVATIEGRLQQGPALWNQAVFTDRMYVSDRGEVRSAVAHDVLLAHDFFAPQLRLYKGTLETLNRFNTVGKLRNLRLSALEIHDAMQGRKTIDQVDEMLLLIDRIQPLTAYLAVAEANMAPDHAWTEGAAAIRPELLNQVRLLGKGEAELDLQSIRRRLANLKAGYVAAYADLHGQAVLGPADDARRRQLHDDPRLQALNALVNIDLLAPNGVELEGWKTALANLRTCTEFHEGLLAESPTCTCNFRPAAVRLTMAASETLDLLNQRLDAILLRWQQALRDNLNSETVQQSITAMTHAERRPITAFLDQPDDDPHIPDAFVPAAAQALQGIDPLTLPVEELIEALKLGGLPCTVNDLKSRFNRFVSQAMRGHDANNTRLTLDE